MVQLLRELPNVWLAAQTGPKQVKSDFTQVMVDLRRSAFSFLTPCLLAATSLCQSAVACISADP